MSKVFCDLGDIPKGKKRGSMKECAEIGKITYWGEKKADKKIIESVVEKKQKKNSLKKMETEYDKMVILFGKIKAKISKLTKDITYEKDNKAAKKK